MSFECSICYTPFDPEESGMVGTFGIIPVYFCATCRVCIRDLAEQEWDLCACDDSDTGLDEDNMGDVPW